MHDEPLRKINWIKFRNDAGSTAPAGGILRITGYNNDAEEPFFTVGRPNAFGSQYFHAVNDDLDVPDGSSGYCCLGQIVPALYDSADGTPAFGESWGPQSGTWKLKKNVGGFRILSTSSYTAGITGEYRCLVAVDPFVRFRGVTDASIAKGASGTISIYYGTGGTYNDTTADMSSVYNDFGDVDSAKNVECVWEGDVAGVKWKIVAAEC